MTTTKVLVHSFYISLQVYYKLFLIFPTLESLEMINIFRRITEVEVEEEEVYLKRLLLTFSVF